MSEEKPKEERVKVRTVEIVIPTCCVENWDSCPHKLQEPKKQKRNVI